MKTDKKYYTNSGDFAHAFASGKGHSSITDYEGAIRDAQHELQSKQVDVVIILKVVAVVRRDNPPIMIETVED